MKALLIIATGRYIDFLQPLIDSCDQHLIGGYDYRIFSDTIPQVKTMRRSYWHYVEHKTWPNSTLMRYHFFAHYADHLKHYDGLVYCDVDMKFVADVEFPFDSDLFAVQHPGYFGGGGSWENNVRSNAFVPHPQRKEYVCGGVQGGAKYLQYAKLLADYIEDDMQRGIWAVWQDESYWNKLFASCKKLFTLLPPSYCYPDNRLKAFHWGLSSIEPKILALEKDHKYYRHG